MSGDSGFNFFNYGDSPVGDDDDEEDEDDNSQSNRDLEFKRDDHDQDDVKDLAMSLPHLTALHRNTASINFPKAGHRRNFSQPGFHGTQKSNTFPSAAVPIVESGNFAVDRSLSVANHNTVSFNDTQTDHEVAVPPAPSSRRRKLRTQGTKRDVKARFLRNDDPNLDTMSEWDQIKKDGLGDIDDRKILTTDDLRETLQDDHMVVHISTHGVHDYPNVRRENEFQIIFQETSIIRYMLEEHRCSAYYAAIAIIFEMELNKFVQYGFSLSKSKKSRRDRLKTWIWKQSPKYTLLANPRIYALFVAICHRFGCDCEFDAEHGIVHIYWGRRTTVREKPHPPMPAYQFVTMFRDDANVQGVLQQIEEQYNRNIVTNSKIVSKLKEFQHFCWEIMCVLLQRLLTSNRAEPEHLDDTKWIENDAYEEENDAYEEDDDEDDNEEAVEDNTNEDGDGGGGDGDDGGDEWADFFGSDNDDEEDEHDNKTDKRTAVKILTHQNSTREIKIVPINIDRQALQQDPKARERLLVGLRHHAGKVITSLKKQPDIQIVFDSKSHTACNVHIVRFENSMSIELATKKINHWKEKLKASNTFRDSEEFDYDIVFSEISHADKGTRHEVGYIRAMQDKVVNIDIKRKRDAIAQMLQRMLKSKRECPIKLVVLNGCHSYILGQMFSDYVESVICVQPYVKIFDTTANVFAREFYHHFRKNLGPHRLMSHTVLMAYDMAKKCVAKECGKDIRCESHSHLRAFESAPSYAAAVKQFSASHHDLQWKKLQQTIEHEQLFAEYSRSHHHHHHRRHHDRQHHHDDHDAINVHDGNTLIVSNLSSQQEMSLLIRYLEDYADDFLYPAATTTSTQKDQPEQPSIKTDFVKRSQFCVDSNYKQFSYAYLNFASSQHCGVAMKILDRKRDDEALLVSDRWVKNLPATMTMPMQMPSHASDDSKDEAVFYKSFSADIADMNLAWIHRRVPRCCCAPHHPHLTQDKLILIQNGQIMNRSIVSNMQVISNGLKQSKHREQQRQQQKRHQHMPPTPQFESPSASTSTSVEEKQDSVSPTSPTSVQATTSNNFQLYAKPKKNSFGGAPKPKPKRRNNFPSVSTQQKSSNFDTPPPRTKTNFQLQVMDENDGDGSNTPSPTTIPKQQIEQKSNFGVVETKERKNKF